jgi:hypothetical protein
LLIPCGVVPVCIVKALTGFLLALPLKRRPNAKLLSPGSVSTILTDEFSIERSGKGLPHRGPKQCFIHLLVRATRNHCKGRLANRRERGALEHIGQLPVGRAHNVSGNRIAVVIGGIQILVGRINHHPDWS